MKKNLFLLALLISVIGCDGDDKKFKLTIRNADPCDAWARPSWQEGPGKVVTPELRDGKASHSLMPAEIIYYSVIENSDSIEAETGIFINPVLVLVYLENSVLLSQGKNFGDFEMRLLKAVGYGGELKKYNGFYPQLVASTYQWRLFQQREMSFWEAQELYPFIDKENFEDTYAKYAKIMNQIMQSNFDLYPNSQGYYQDFFDYIGIYEIQTFLEIINSSLQENLFNQFPVSNTAIDYADVSGYCE